MLAKHVAEGLGMPMLSWHIKSTTKAADGLYVYDTVQRLNDSRFGGGDVADIRRYIKLGPLGQAFAADERHVLLIDEVDKADLEFPNDLLRELDEMRFSIIETSEEIVASERPVVLITSNNEKELPDAFLRRCIFHFIEFPDAALMRKIIDVHHPNLDAKLLDQVLIKFYWLREQNELRKKPSTSELIDWICGAAALRHQPGADRGAHPVHRRAPQEGARRSAAEVRRARRLIRRRERLGPYNQAKFQPTTWADLAAPLQSVTRRARGKMFLDLFYGLRDEGVPVAIQEWFTLLEALQRGMHGSSLLRFYHLARACLVKSETYFDAFDRVFARVFKGVEGALGDDVTEKVLEWLRDPKNFPDLSPERARGARAPLVRRADAALPRDARRADRAPRRRRPLGRHRRQVAVRPRRPAPDRHPRRRPGRAGRR